MPLGGKRYNRTIYQGEKLDEIVQLYFTKSQMEEVNEWLDRRGIPGMSFSHSLREWILVGVEADIDINKFKTKVAKEAQT
jgi:hypothetical protein